MTRFHALNHAFKLVSVLHTGTIFTVHSTNMINASKIARPVASNAPPTNARL